MSDVQTSNEMRKFLPFWARELLSMQDEIEKNHKTVEASAREAV